MRLDLEPQALGRRLEEGSVGAGVAGCEVLAGGERGHVGGGLVGRAGESHVGHRERGGAGARDGEGVLAVRDGAPADVPIVELGRGALAHGVGVRLAGLLGVGVVGYEVDGLGHVEGQLEERGVVVGVRVGGDLCELLVAVELRLEAVRELIGDAGGHARVDLVLVGGRLVAPVGAPLYAAGNADNKEDDEDERESAEDEHPPVGAAAPTAALEIDAAGTQRVAAVAEALLDGRSAPAADPARAGALLRSSRAVVGASEVHALTGARAAGRRAAASAAGVAGGALSAAHILAVVWHNAPSCSVAVG